MFGGEDSFLTGMPASIDTKIAAIGSNFTVILFLS
jgi:hypothetical protein